jgi:hypothetical protein
VIAGRVHKSLHRQIRQAAKASGRTMSDEMAFRLGQSFAEERVLGGEAGRRLLYLIASAFVFAGERYHYAQQLKAPPGGSVNVSDWINDPQTYAAAMMGAVEAMMAGQPDSTREICMLQLGSLLGSTPTRAFWVKPGEPQ